MTTVETLRALSVRQPWAWALVAGVKSIENRGHVALMHMGYMRGVRRIAIHAAKGMTRDEYETARDFMWSMGVECPQAADLLRGGVIGAVDVVGVVNKSPSPWFFGPRGIIVANPQPCEFIPAVGQLGLFDWKRAGSEIVPKPARWMRQDRFPPIEGPLL